MSEKRPKRPKPKTAPKPGLRRQSSTESLKERRMPSERLLTESLEDESLEEGQMPPESLAESVKLDAVPKKKIWRALSQRLDPPEGISQKSSNEVKASDWQSSDMQEQLDAASRRMQETMLRLQHLETDRIVSLEEELKRLRDRLGEVEGSQNRLSRMSSRLGQLEKTEIAGDRFSALVGKVPTQKDDRHKVSLKVTEKMARRDRVAEIARRKDEHRDQLRHKIEMRIDEYRDDGKIDHHGANCLTEDERNAIDEEYLMQQYAKAQIQNSKSNAEIMMKAELLIDSDWLAQVDALPGNIFCLGVFGDFLRHTDGGMFSSYDALKCYMKFFMCFLIVCVQVAGPPLIFLSAMPQNVGIVEDESYQWRCWPISRFFALSDTEACQGGKVPRDVTLIDDWYTITSTRVLSTIFMLMFILNGIFVVQSEKGVWKRIYNTLRYLDQVTPEFKMSGHNYLNLGAFVNCWVILWSCLDAYLIIGATASPRDLMFDALGLLFLYNLDDIGGDLGFIDETDWPGEQIAWIYEEVVHPCDDDIFNEDNLDMRGHVFLTLYKFTALSLAAMLVVLPVMAAITPFTQIAPND